MLAVRLLPFLISISMLPNERLIVPFVALSIAPDPPPSSLGIVTEKSPVYPVPASVTVADVIVPLVTIYVARATLSLLMAVSYTHLRAHET